MKLKTYAMFTGDCMVGWTEPLLVTGRPIHLYGYHTLPVKLYARMSAWRATTPFSLPLAYLVGRPAVCCAAAAYAARLSVSVCRVVLQIPDTHDLLRTSWRASWHSTRIADLCARLFCAQLLVPGSWSGVHGLLVQAEIPRQQFPGSILVTSFYEDAIATFSFSLSFRRVVLKIQRARLVTVADMLATRHTILTCPDGLESR